jgi:fucose 4-O-acetylase-like acetyltransferase
MPAHPPPVTFAEKVSAATAPDRDRFIDAVRAGSLLVVVLGHWLMATVVVKNGHLTGENALTSIPALQLATWLLQVMPLFFIAGGFSNITVWRSLRRRGAGYSEYLQGRLVRLLRPTLVFVVFWHLALPAAAALGMSQDRVDLIGKLLGQPLWFLGVYVAMTALAPAMASWHALSPRTALATLAIGAVVIDWFRMAKGMESVGYLNLAVVWLFAQQLGFAYADGYFTRLSRRTLWVTTAAAFATLAVLTTWGPYPVSMVGMPDEISNMTPPTICLLVLAVAQTAIAMLVRGRVSGWLERPRLWANVVRFASMAMTVYLWHLSLLVFAFIALIGLGIDPPAAGSGLWWLTRPFWLLGLALVLSVVATLLSPLERGRPAKVAKATSRPHGTPANGLQAKESQPARTPTAILQTVGSSLGAALSAFGLLGYVASGLQPALPGSSVLLFVPVDPIQNTACVLAGLGLSTLATRWSLRRPGSQPVHPGQRPVIGLQNVAGRRHGLTRTNHRQRRTRVLLDRDGKARGALNNRLPAKHARSPK